MTFTYADFIQTSKRQYADMITSLILDRVIDVKPMREDDFSKYYVFYQTTSGWGKYIINSGENKFKKGAESYQELFQESIDSSSC